LSAGNAGRDEENAGVAQRLKDGLESQARRDFHQTVRWSIASRTTQHELRLCRKANRSWMGINDVAVSSGSAWHLGNPGTSYVLKALGVGEEPGSYVDPIGLGRFNTEEKSITVIDKMVQVVTKLRELSPLYEWPRKGSTSPSPSGQIAYLRKDRREAKWQAQLQVKEHSGFKPVYRRNGRHLSV